MAILAGWRSMWLIVGHVARNIKAENHAKLMTTATFLARARRWSSIEDELYEKGFGEVREGSAGDFDDKGFARFTWKIVVDKVELPSPEQMQTVLTNAQQARQTAQASAAPTPALQPLGGLNGRRRRLGRRRHAG